MHVSALTSSFATGIVYGRINISMVFLPPEFLFLWFLHLAKGKRICFAKASLRPNIVDSQAIWLRGQDIAARNGLLYSAVETMDTLHDTNKQLDGFV